MFIFSKPHSLTLLKIAAVFEVLPKKAFCLLPCDVT